MIPETDKVARREIELLNALESAELTTESREPHSQDYDDDFEDGDDYASDFDSGEGDDDDSERVDTVANLLNTSKLQEFDARKCECFVPEEREKILTIIATAFGGCDAFNAEVRYLLQRTQEDSMDDSP